MNSLTHITTETISFPFVSHRQAGRRPPPLVSGSPRFSVAARKVRGTNSIIGGGKGMSWFHELEQEVREYELDRFGVVNHAVYNNYCEYGTYKLFDMIGFEADTKLAVTEALHKFVAPLKKDKYVLKTRIYDYSNTRLYCEYQISKLQNHEPIIFGSRATLVLINERLRPCRIPPSMISKFNNFLLTYQIK